LDFKNFLLLKKRYWIIEILYIIISIIFIVKVRLFNQELKINVMSDIESSDIEKAFNVLSYGDNSAMNYIMFGFGIIFVGVIFSVYLFFKSKSEWEYKEESFVLSFIILAINVCLIISILVALSNPILWALFIITGLGAVIMVGFSS